MNKLAIVTGGGSGIGLAITEKFVRTGIRTVIIGRDKKKLDETQHRLGALCEPVCYDLTCLSGIPRLVQDLHKRFGQIDVLVNNAGINLKKEFTEVTDEEFQKILRTNVSSIFALSREVVKVMLDSSAGGAVINISSMASQYGIPKVIAYSASKAAIEGMTRAMAVELSPKGIRVNCIAPGFIATDMSAKALNNDPERKQKVMSRTPMGHLGTPANIGDAALFLASDAAKYITGIVLPVDGGNSIGF
ncbi:MAG: 3-oxoacyl-ACP reductase [Sphingobacteriales bacterium 50-39]|nr:SDR family oxidoreductase [Sphingobacteriales bacterium]OJW55963.1 MAG: 3-oxoacyl-ACP reductase [Sphingobacteriales bacterium 50-39]